MAKENTQAFKKQLRIDIIMKRSEVIGYRFQMDELEKEMTAENTCVSNYIELSNKKNNYSDQLTKAEGEMKNLQTKYESLK